MKMPWNLLSVAMCVFLAMSSEAKAEMIVSDRPMKDITDSMDAMKEQWKKEAAGATSRFKSGTYTDLNGFVFRYGLVLPAKVDTGVKYPLYVGGDAKIAFALSSSQAQYPCYVMSCWVPDNLVTKFPDWKSVTASAYKVVIDKVVAENPSIDTARISVSGASRFGSIAFISAYNYPDTYAAIMPSVCGLDISKTLQIASRKIGIWMFYGVLDGGTVEDQLKKTPKGRGLPHIYKALHDAGPDCMFTVYTHGIHYEYGFTDSPTNPEWNDFTRMRKWMFEQKKPIMLWPVITSATTSAAIAGKPFTYTITADKAPTSFSAVVSIEHAEAADGTIAEPKEPLPSGLSFDPKTGVISGTPKEAGRFFIRLNASNDKGVGITTLALTIMAE